MNVRSVALGALVLWLPVVVEVPTSPDSGSGGESETRITLVGGAGHYAIIDRGCEGQVLRTHPARFREAGGSIEHRSSNGLTSGVRSGVLREKRESRFVVTDYSVYPYRESLAVVVSETENVYVNPFVAVEGRRLGIGAGWAWARGTLPTLDSKRQPSFHVRIGRLDKAYFKLGYLESVPLYSGGGFADIGFGGHPHRLWDIYMGMSGGPFDGPGLSLKCDYRVRPHWAITGRARLGESGGEAQNGMGLGLTYSSLSPAAPPQVKGMRARESGGP